MRAFRRGQVTFGIYDSRLVDRPLRGGDFTWSRSGVDVACLRLDRFMVSLDWEE